MKHLVAMLALVIGLGGPFWAQAETSEDLKKSDVTAIREAVQSQLEAFLNDDADGAFELATLEKQILIGSPDNFMQLIRDQYEPIYRHQLAIFFQPEVVHGSAIQLVRVTDSNSRVWLAIFWMQQDEDSSWKIDGCHLLETASVSV